VQPVGAVFQLERLRVAAERDALVVDCHPQLVEPGVAERGRFDHLAPAAHVDRLDAVGHDAADLAAVDGQATRGPLLHLAGSGAATGVLDVRLERRQMLSCLFLGRVAADHLAAVRLLDRVRLVGRTGRRVLLNLVGH
jgi:hypothetical protein